LGKKTEMETIKAIIFDENVFDDNMIFHDPPHVLRALADVEEGKFHICDKCKDFIFRGIVMPEVDNLAIKLWSDIASRFLSTGDFTLDVFKDFDVTRRSNCRIIGEIEILNPEALIRRAKQFERIDGFWNSHKSRIGNSLRRALFKEVEELLGKAGKAPPQLAFQPS